uniref:Spiroplasma plectrovirus-related protein n=1 Tax=Heterorhabditis bacteriophora TaxID=37862 RepID=A0A1I7WJD2_HETBA
MTIVNTLKCIINYSKSYNLKQVENNYGVGFYAFSSVVESVRTFITMIPNSNKMRFIYACIFKTKYVHTKAIMSNVLKNYIATNQYRVRFLSQLTILPFFNNFGLKMPYIRWVQVLVIYFSALAQLFKT